MKPTNTTMLLQNRNRYPDYDDSKDLMMTDFHNIKATTHQKKNSFFVDPFEDDENSRQQDESIKTSNKNEVDPTEPSTSSAQNYSTAASAFGWRQHKPASGLLISGSPLDGHNNSKNNSCYPNNNYYNYNHNISNSNKPAYSKFNNSSYTSSGSASEYGNWKGMKYNEKSSTGSTQSQKLFCEQAIVRGSFRAFIITAIVSVLLFFPPLLNLGLYTSCRKDSLVCLPKFEIQTKEVEPIYFPEATTLIRNVAGVIMTKEVDDDEIESLRRSVENKLFKLNYQGYCKVDVSSKRQICYSFDNSLDLLSVVIKDIGIQMSGSIIGDPDVISNEFVDAYYKVLEVSSSTSTTAYEAYLSSILGKYLPYSMILHFLFTLFGLITCQILLFWLNNPKKKHDKRITKMVILALLFVFIGLLAYSADLAVETVYIGKLDDLLYDYNIAAVFEGAGLTMQYVVLGCQVAAFFILFILLLVKPWVGRTIKKSNVSLI